MTNKNNKKNKREEEKASFFWEPKFHLPNKVNIQTPFFRFFVSLVCENYEKQRIMKNCEKFYFCVLWGGEKEGERVIFILVVVFFLIFFFLFFIGECLKKKFVWSCTE